MWPTCGYVVTSFAVPACGASPRPRRLIGPCEADADLTHGCGRVSCFLNWTNPLALLAGFFIHRAGATGSASALRDRLSSMNSVLRLACRMKAFVLERPNMPRRPSHATVHLQDSVDGSRSDRWESMSKGTGRASDTQCHFQFGWSRLVEWFVAMRLRWCVAWGDRVASAYINAFPSMIGRHHDADQKGTPMIHARKR